MAYSIDRMPERISIGRETETGVTDVMIDCGAWVSKWPGMTLHAIYTPEGGAPYILQTETDGSVLVWHVTDADTATPGTGIMEIVGETDGRRKVSAMVKVYVAARMSGTVGEPPDAAKPWADRVVEAAERITGMQVQAETLDAGSSATAAWDGVQGLLTICVPKGEQGPKGEKGEKGPQGEKGEPGKDAVVDATLTQSGQAADAKVTGDALAYKLTEPSSGLEVGKYFRIAAIDENGHAVLEAVDLPSAPVQDVQVNGVSVVADGVANVGIDKPYELIEEITMEEEAKIIRKNEPNGTNYNFKSFLIIGETPVISVKKYIVILINTEWAVSFTLELNSKRYFAAKIYVEGGRMFSSSTYGASSDAITSMHTRNRNSFGLHAMNTINKFETSEDHFPMGTKIKLYGVRA